MSTPSDETSIGRAGRAVQRAGHSNLLIGGIAALAVLALLATLLVFGKEIHDNDAATARANRVVAQILAERAQRRTQVTNEIRGLACFAISQIPDSPKRPVIHELRTRYDCPPYSRKNARRALRHLVPAEPRPSATPTPTATSTPAPRGKHRGRHRHHRR